MQQNGQCIQSNIQQNHLPTTAFFPDFERIMAYGLEGHKVLTVLNTRIFGTKCVFQLSKMRLLPEHISLARR